MANNDEFSAPAWVSDNKEEQPLTQKQKYFFIGTLCVVIPFCLWAGWFEYHRAQEGHWRAWVYAFEWPFIAGVAIYMYRRFLQGDFPKIPKPNLEELNKGEDEK